MFVFSYVALRISYPLFYVEFVEFCVLHGFYVCFIVGCFVLRLRFIVFFRRLFFACMMGMLCICVCLWCSIGIRIGRILLFVRVLFFLDWSSCVGVVLFLLVLWC